MYVTGPAGFDGSFVLELFVHNRAWLTAAACESALTGSMEGVRKDGQPQEAASVRSRELGNVGFLELRI